MTPGFRRAQGCPMLAQNRSGHIMRLPFAALLTLLIAAGCAIGNGPWSRGPGPTIF